MEEGELIGTVALVVLGLITLLGLALFLAIRGLRKYVRAFWPHS